MVARFAYAYVFLLATLEIPIIILTFALHVSVIMGVKEPSMEYGAILFRASVILAVPAAAFIRDSLEWTNQVRSCPAWMWKTALGLASYSGIVLVLQMLFSEDPSFSDQALIMSGFPIGFDAMAICILYPVLRSGYLDRTELTKRAAASMIMVALGVSTFLAYQAGYLRHPKS